MSPIAAPTYRAVTTALAAALLSACASGRIAARDESAERIETAIGVPALEEPVPDGLPFYAESPPPMSDALALNEAEEEEEEEEAEERPSPFTREGRPPPSLCTPANDVGTPRDSGYPECTEMPTLRYIQGPGAYQGPLP